MKRFRKRNIKALFILNIKKTIIFKIRSKCITFVGIDHICIDKDMFVCYSRYDKCPGK